ncbi:glycosyltransferase [Acinetobacter gyllenbergii]|uniref:glycosyltransferase n=1 Tax=Acinetobacter gyllenbergii TaxID=134534 RepID=UPI0003BE3674|nr:glycosyltransferase [Acinetobacter gyllenbergii]ESK38517.1 hypothetical protein F987_03093 [Acinetobacter gyllenbergii NIPH 230]
MKSIVFVVHSFDEEYRGGVLKATSDVANSLVNYNYNVKVLSLGKVGIPAFYLDKRITLESLCIDKYSTQFYMGIKKFIWFFDSYRILNGYVRNNQDAIFVATSPPLNMLFSLLKMNFKKTLIIGCDHTSASYKSNGFLGRLKWSLYKKIDCFVALTELDNIFYEENGVKSIYIPNFINLDKLRDIKTNGKFFLLFVGRFSQEKRPLLALEAYRKSGLVEKGINLRMFGDGDLYPLIQSYIQSNNLCNNVEVISGLSDPDLIYKDAYGLLMTSSLEGFGMVLIEAISRNIPCISFDVPCGPSSIIKNGVNGFLVQDGNIEEMGQRLVEIENGNFDNIQHTIESFDEKVVILKWLALLSSLESKGVFL